MRRRFSLCGHSAPWLLRTMPPPPQLHRSYRRLIPTAALPLAATVAFSHLGIAAAIADCTFPAVPLPDHRLLVRPLVAAPPSVLLQ